MARTWRLQPGQLLRHRSWDDEVLVFNNLSGDTHLLGPGALQVLLALLQQPMATSALAALLLIAPDEHDELDTLLASLKKLGLIETAP